MVIASLILTVVLSISFFALSSSPVTADTTTSATAAVIVSAACNISSTVDKPHSATIPAGMYKTEIGTTTFKVLCNDTAGFSVYTIGYSNEEYGNTKLLATIGGNLDSTHDVVTGTATSGSTSNWAMKLTAVSGTYAPTIQNSFSSYHIVPDVYTQAATFASNTDATVGSSLQATYAAYIAGTQPAGYYDGIVKYTVVHPNNERPANEPKTCDSNKICYWPAASDVVGIMANKSISTSDTSAVLYASNYSRENYGFAGWSDVFDYDTNPNAHFYGPNETITFTARQYSSSGLSLYAVWVPSAGSLQSSTDVNRLCGNSAEALTTAPTDGTANLDSVSALTDQRDGDTYAIAKLADGKCWMIENLRLDDDATGNSTGSLAQGYNTTNFIGLANAESPWATSSSNTTPNSLYSTDGSTTKTISGNNLAYRFPRYNNQNTTSRQESASSYSISSNVYSYGNYYTWAAAVADTDNYTQNNVSQETTSICPSGWHLPTGGGAYASGNTGGVNVTGDTSTYREFYNLGYEIMDEVKTAYEDTPNSGASYYSSNTTNLSGDTATKAFRKYPNNFVYSGNVGSSLVNDRSSYGVYWSSTAYSGISSYYLYLRSSAVYPGTGNSYKYYGRSIRCIAGS